MSYQGFDKDIFLGHRQAALDRATSSGLKNWKPTSAMAGTPPHRNTIRVLPAHPSMGGNPILHWRQHFSLGPNMDTAALCLEFFKKPCLACDAAAVIWQKMREAGGRETEEGKILFDRAVKVSASDRYGINMVDLGNQARGVQPWMMGRKNHEQLLTCFFDDAGVLREHAIVDPDRGRNVLIDAVKQQKQPQFNDYPLFRAAEQESVIANRAWLAQLIDLPGEIIVEPTEDDLVGAMRGVRIRPRSMPSLPPTAAPRAIGAGSTTPGVQGQHIPAPTQPVYRESPVDNLREPAPVDTPRPRRTKTVPAPAASPVVDGTPHVPRTPVVDEVQAPAPNGGGDFWQKSIALLAEVGIQTKPQWAQSFEVLATKRKPSCYTREFLATDSGCQGCAVVLPCAAAKLGYLPKAAESMIG